MKKLFIISIIFFLFLNFSNQLDCQSLTGETCEGYNTEYELSCRQFNDAKQCQIAEVDPNCTLDSDHFCSESETNPLNYLCYNFGDPNKCKKIKYDDGCAVSTTDDLTCKKNEYNYYISYYEDCFWENSDKKYCKRVTKKCDLYSDSDCGGLKGIYQYNVIKQCIQLRDNGKCYDIELDSFCEFDDSTKKCTKRSIANFDEKKKICDFNYDKTKCKLRNKECNIKDYTLETCSDYGSTCRKIEDNACKIIPDNDYCEVNDDGRCVKKEGAEIPEYQECSFDIKYTKCEPLNKYCSLINDTTLCSYGLTSSSKYQCKKVEENSYCKEVKVISGCEIDDDGKCIESNPSEQNNNECKYNSDKSICQFYQIDLECKFDFNTSVCSNDNLQNNTQICDSNPYVSTQCIKRTKVCSDFTDQESCEASEGVKTSTKKCSWSDSGYPNKCKEFEKDDTCTVIGWECRLAEGKTISENEKKECLFNYEQTSCIKRDQICSNYFESDKCSKFDAPDKNIQCYKFSYENYCKEIEYDDTCQVKDDSCTNMATINSTTICDFNVYEDKTTCKIRSKTCSDYDTYKTCYTAEGCVYYNGKCMIKEVDESCKLITSNNCDADGQISDYEICAFSVNDDFTKATCQKREKLCSDILEENGCVSFIPKEGSNYQCYYTSLYDGIQSCKNITTDGKCKINILTGECEEDGVGALEANEICDYLKIEYENDGSYYLYCKAREKNKCSDYIDSHCGNFSIESPVCFNLLDGRGCREISIDSQCTIEGTKCVGNGCSFNDNNSKDKCVYKNISNNNNSGILLKQKRFILLVLALIF